MFPLLITNSQWSPKHEMSTSVLLSKGPSNAHYCGTSHTWNIAAKTTCKITPQCYLTMDVTHYPGFVHLRYLYVVLHTCSAFIDEVVMTGEKACHAIKAMNLVNIGSALDKLV